MAEDLHASAGGSTDRPPADPPMGERSSIRGHLWIVRRIGLAVFVLLAMSLLAFIATTVLPSDPARAILGPEASSQAVEAMRQRLGLDRPMMDQYLSWLSSALRGDLGRSLASGVPVSSLVAEYFANSLVLVILSAAIAVILAIGIGTVAGLRRDGVFDDVALGASVILNAIPPFVIAIVLLFLLSTNVLRLLPPVSIILPGQSPLSSPLALVLPVASLVISLLPYLFRLVRGSMVEELESEHIQLARLKGLSSRRVAIGHALPNMWVPIIQGTALSLVFLAGGIVVIENIFSFPGVGTALSNAIASRDLPLIVGLSMTLAVFVVVVNLVADLLTVYVTPRLRTGGL